MGKNQIPSDWKQCCTCEYWAGNREIYGYNRVVVETTNPGGIGERGKCLNSGSGWRNSLQQHSSKCEKWEKWRVLK